VPGAGSRAAVWVGRDAAHGCLGSAPHGPRPPTGSAAPTGSLGGTAPPVTCEGARRPGGTRPPVTVSAVYAQESSPLRARPQGRGCCGHVGR
jgi:hypothetical protein